MSSPHRRAKSQNSISSTSIPQGPRFSPPKSPTKDSSPVRKPLHERSHSQTNQHAGPTIRIVQDPSDDIYQKYPVPSEPSQILPPPRHAPGYGFERPDRPGSLVSNGSQVANTIAKFEASRAQTPQPILSRRKGRRHSAATSMSEEDTLIASSFTPSSVRFSQGSTAPSSPPPEFEDYDKGLEVLEEEPPVQRQTIRAVPPSSSGGDSLDSRALTPKASAASFASPVPAAEPSSFSNAGNPSSVSVGRPLPQDDEHTPTPESEAGRSALACYTDYRQPVLKPQQSTDSFTFSDISYTSIEPTTSPTLHEASTASFASGIRLNYPVVRAASSNSLRADSQNLPNISSRMQDRSLIHNWSSQLSTIPSGSERDSRSIARASRSQSFGARSHSQESYGGNGRTTIPRRRGQTVSSAQSSSDNVSEGHTEFSAVPRPLFSPVSRGSSDNNSEHMDTISPLPSSIPLRMKNSGYLRRNNSVDGLSVTESRPESSGRPGSASSNMSNFLANNIPAWARMYYQKGERISVAVPPESESSGSIRPGTSQSGRSRTPSESNFPLSIYRPRNRPRNRAASHTDTVSLADDVHSIDGAAYGNGPQMYQLTGYSTPHLRTDQRGQALYSAWNAPSLDDDVHLTLFGRQNRQILLFCLGFLCPLTWMIASFLPLPLDPNSAATPTSSQADLEQQFAQNMGPANDKAFQKATWWRNLNRVMSGVGTLLIGVIVALAILASRM